MKSVFASLIVAGLLLGCGRTSDPESTSETATHEMGSLARYAGEWSLQALPMEGDSALVEFSMVATDNMDGWSIDFEHLAEPVPAQVTTTTGDSLSVAFGPYASALREDVVVSVESIMDIDGDQLTGIFTANYETGEPLSGRIRGTRKN